MIADAQIYAKPWGFSLDEVRVPVRLWHGKEDRAFSVRLAEEIANRLPDCNARYVDGAGHYSLPIRHIREILQDLIHCSGRRVAWFFGHSLMAVGATASFPVR